jgi:hypothetical protein
MVNWGAGGDATFVLAAAFLASTSLLARVAQRRCAVRIHWRPVVFSATLFWCWYLAPAALESSTIEHVIKLLTP